MKPGLRRGQLTTWKDEQGFGFIQPADGSQDVFLHITALKDRTRRPKAGDVIYYHLTFNQNREVRADKAFILGARAKSTSASRRKSTSRKTVLKHLVLVLETLFLSALPLWGSIQFAWAIANPIPLILYPVMGLWTFALYKDDKSRAKRDEWRIPENRLHLYELAGGWLGGFIAQRTIRHKNQKRSYQAVFWVIVTLHLLFWLGWFFLSKTR
ncbi:DUF1294 domain-containing protein [Myxacorys almedinensis]|uniref:DUF1294 domain-containing protein n=1 Tax=Myxacorys almedinensis A TaxID=2690445 RepID=A0A8J7Z3A0_9CYAN|nr:cold shock and DUF1294 domain-containing protein [Myxacorys almedinensis]NDJ19602.1 DUF1294 domain-containing protein [Myxacorys almedinensis A]